MTGPLSGLLVADFSRILAGPYATMLLADLGADVVKVEAPGGRRHPVLAASGPRRDVSTYYLAVNRNKRSIALDLKDAGDRGGASWPGAPTCWWRTSSRAGWPAFGLDYETVSPATLGWSTPRSAASAPVRRARSCPATT